MGLVKYAKKRIIISPIDHMFRYFNYVISWTNPTGGQRAAATELDELTNIESFSESSL